MQGIHVNRHSEMDPQPLVAARYPGVMPFAYRTAVLAEGQSSEVDGGAPRNFSR
jgi:hypothetical protein